RVPGVVGVRGEGGGVVGVGEDHLPALEAGDVPALRGGDRGDRVAGGALVERGVGEVRDVVEDERGVDLVGEDAAAVAVDHLGYLLELGAAEDAAHGVPRVAQHEQAGAGGEGGVDRLEVEAVAAVGVEDRRDLDDLAVVRRHGGEEGDVRRGGDDDRRAGRGESLDGDAHRG